MKYQTYFDDGRQAFLDDKAMLGAHGQGKLSIEILCSDDGIAKHAAYNEGWTKQMLCQPIEGWTDEENAAAHANRLASW